MCVITEKKQNCNETSLGYVVIIFYHWWYFDWGGGGAGPFGPLLATPMAKAKDRLLDDRHSQGQGQECSRSKPRTQGAIVLKKKKGFQKNFPGNLKKKKKKVFVREDAEFPQKRYSKKKSLRKFSARFLPLSKIK